MSNTFSDALSLQGRVLWALCLREIHGKHGRFRIGYLWQLIRVAFSVAVFWWIREVNSFHPPQGLSTPIFLLMGFVPWFMFSESIAMVMEAVRTNRALLTFPQVTPLDLCLSSSLVIAATQVLVLGLFMAGLVITGFDLHLRNAFVFITALTGVALLGFGTGLVLLALNLYLPALEKLVPMVLRIMFFTTGVFFSPTQMTAGYGDAIMWLPTANYIELLRASFVGTAIPDLIKVEYTIFITAALLVLGLLLERHVRSVQESA